MSQSNKLWVGLLALLAPIPLPFNEMAAWLATAAYLLLVGGWLIALRRGARLLLPPWLLNLAGGLYLPVLLVDLASAEGGQVLRPLVHVAMFATAAKLFALRGERDKWHALLGAFFLFVAGMGSSVHPALVLHMLVFSTIAVATLVQFAESHSMRSFAAARPTPGKSKLVAGVIGLTVLGCAILFPLLPRVAQPYVAGGGAVDLGGPGGISAFAEDLTLDSIGRIRNDRSVALRLVFEGPVPDEIRLKGSSYDLYRDQRWLRTKEVRFVRARSGWLALDDRSPVQGEVAVFSRLAGAEMMPILTEAVAVESDSRWIGLAPGGDLRPVRWRGAPLRYRSSYGRVPMTHAVEPPNPETLDQSGVTPAITSFAEQFLSGADSRLDQVRALERHLQEEFTYSLDLNLDPGRPIEDFLLRRRAGHCEYFASALVLLLRSQGIPARIVSGFLGADGNPLEAFHVVRNANAHAWVEAWVEGRWRILDPTPAAARPAPDSSGGAGLWQRLLDTYDWLIYRWDRYVLTYDSEEQTSFVAAIGAWFRELWRALAAEDGSVAVASGELEPALDPSVSPPQPASDESRPAPWIGLLLAVLVGVSLTVWFWRRRTRRLSATGLYLELRSSAPRAGVAADETSGPGRVVDNWTRLQPDLEPQLRSILDAYLEESFGGREVARGELMALEEDWKSVKKGLSRAA